MGGLEAADPRYAALWASVERVLGSDPRVRSVELAGSLAAGTADEWSDLDLVVVTDAAHHDAFLAAWPEWLAAITPTVFARTPIAPFIVNCVTDEGLTLDISVHPGEVLQFPVGPGYAVGSLSGVRFADIGEALEYAVAEQLRGMAGPFVSLVRRGEHFRHLTGVPHLLGLLSTVFLAETGAAPPRKLWNATYTDEQLATVAALPAVSADRDALVTFGLAVARLTITRSRPLYDRYGLVWPSELAAVVAQRLQDALDIDASDWLF